MRSALDVSSVTFTAADVPLRATGLLGFVRFTLDDAVVIDGVEVRRFRAGRIGLSWPRRNSIRGEGHAVRPADDEARAYFECELIDELRRRGVPL